MGKSKLRSLCALPYFIWLILFIAFPLVLVIFNAFSDGAGNFTIDNLAQAGEYTPVLMQSIWLALVATFVCIIIAYPISYIISRMSPMRRKAYIMLIMLPMWMNFLLRTYAWMTLLENNGVINRILMYFGIQPLEMINTHGAVILGMVYNFIPFMILPLYSTMIKINNQTIEAAQDLGAGSFQVFSKVVLPLSMTGISTGVTLVFVPAVSTFIISQFLGGGNTMLIGDIIELQFSGNAYNPNLGSAISLILMVVVLLCMSIMNSFDDEGMEGMLI